MDRFRWRKTLKSAALDKPPATDQQTDCQGRLGASDTRQEAQGQAVAGFEASVT